MNLDEHFLVGKRRILAFTSGRLQNAATASAKGRLLLPATIFMKPKSRDRFALAASFHPRGSASEMAAECSKRP